MTDDQVLIWVLVVAYSVTLLFCGWQRRKIDRLEALLCELVKAMAEQALAAARVEWPIDIAVLPDCDCPACAKGRERRN